MKTLLVFLFVSNSLFGQNDKLLHLSAGYVSASFTSGVLQHYNVKHSILIGFSSGVVLGIGKEIYDEYFTPRGEFDPIDLLYTVSGATMGCLTIKFSIPNKKKPVLNPGPF